MYYKGTGSLLTLGGAPLDITSESVKVSTERADDESLLSSRVQSTKDIKAISVSGTISFLLHKESAGELFKMALGSEEEVTSVGTSEGTGGSTGGGSTGGSYRHSFILSDDAIPEETVIIDRHAGVKSYTGVSISTLTLECQAGEIVKGSIDIIGIKEETGSAITKPSFSTPYKCTKAKFTIAGEELDITNATVKLDNALEQLPRTYSSGVYYGGAVLGRRSVTLTIEVPYSEAIEELKDKYLTSDETAEVVLTFGDITITIPNLVITEVDATVSGTGLLTSTFTGEAIEKDEPITITVINDRSAKYE